MIDSELSQRAAVLALKIVAIKYILPGKINALVRGVNISIEANDRWHWKTFCDRMQPVPVGRSDQLTLVQENENKGPLHGTNHQWTVILIKHQYSAVHLKIIYVKDRYDQA